MNRFRGLWHLDQEITFLNHGSFGACPRTVLDAQSEFRHWMEREPVQFFRQDLPPLLLANRVALGGFLGCDPDDLAFVANTTTGVNTVLRSLILRPGDEIVVTNHEYNACRNAVEHVSRRRGARVVVARLPFPIASEELVLETILAAVTPRTRLALVDHVTSPTALVLPVERLARELAPRGVDLLVDGAHAPGMIDVELKSLGAPFYTGNCHKWLCAPKGAAFLYVDRDRQGEIRPLTISHGANAPVELSSRFRCEFDWQGTDDPTAWLSISEAIRALGDLLPGGWPELRRRNRALALAAGSLLAESLGHDGLAAPEGMLGSMVALPLASRKDARRLPRGAADPLQGRLLAEGRIEVPVIAWDDPQLRLLRISAQVYNDLAEYERLAATLTSTQSGLSD